MVERRITIWAQSICRSTMALYREVKRRAEARVIVREDMEGKEARQFREAMGQCVNGYEDVVDYRWDGREDSGLELLDNSSIGIQVFSGYQRSEAIRKLIRKAKARGDKVVISDEAPCERCVGMKALLKRIYYYLILPPKLRPTIGAADMMMCSSGRLGIDRLRRLGWRDEQIVPFGYASERLGSGEVETRTRKTSAPLKILHLGDNDKRRGTDILQRAVEKLERAGLEVELKMTGAKLPMSELLQELKNADVMVACGRCEPWGMRVNDALLEGCPVIVSDGMGVEMAVERYGCGAVVPRGDSQALAMALKRCAQDDEYYQRIASGAKQAAEMMKPSRRAEEWLETMERICAK